MDLPLSNAPGGCRGGGGANDGATSGGLTRGASDTSGASAAVAGVAVCRQHRGKRLLTSVMGGWA